MLMRSTARHVNPEMLLSKTKGTISCVSLPISATVEVQSTQSPECNVRNASQVTSTKMVFVSRPLFLLKIVKSTTLMGFARSAKENMSCQVTTRAVHLILAKLGTTVLLAPFKINLSVLDVRVDLSLTLLVSVSNALRI
jgi:hypothetical protein